MEPFDFLHLSTIRLRLRIKALGGTMKTLAALLGLLFFTSSALAKPREWKPATVASITSSTDDRGVAVVPIGGGLYGGHVYVTTVWYRIETEDTTYVLAWSRKKHPLNLTLHGQTKIAIDGQNAHILDDSGKDIKVLIAEKIAREKKP